MSKSEDELIRKLQRLPYHEVRKLYLEAPLSINLMHVDQRTTQEFFAHYGWTIEEFTQWTSRQH